MIQIGKKTYNEQEGYLIFSGRMPNPPGVNHAYRPGKVWVTDKYGRRVQKSRLIATPELEMFKWKAAQELKAAFRDEMHIEMHSLLPPARRIPLFCRLTFFYETWWKHDDDSGEKHARDAAFLAIGLNDSCVVDTHCRKRVDRDDPHCEIEVYEMLPL